MFISFKAFKKLKKIVACCCKYFLLKGKSYFNSNGFNIVVYSQEVMDNGIYKQHDWIMESTCLSVLMLLCIW